MHQYKYNILLPVLTISILLFSACGNSNPSTAQTYPEDDFNSVSEDYQYASDNLNAYITDAHNLMDAIPDTDISDECIAPAYEELSELLQKS